MISMMPFFRQQNRLHNFIAIKKYASLRYSPQQIGSHAFVKTSDSLLLKCFQDNFQDIFILLLIRICLYELILNYSSS